MAAEAKTVLRGINAVGHITDPYGSPTKVQWGYTPQDGASLNISPEAFLVLTGQTRVAVEEFVTNVDILFDCSLQFADLLTMVRALGLADDDSGFTGDLQASPTPTDEVLKPAITAFFETERYMYVETPGPKGVRTIEFQRARPKLNGSLDFASTSNVIVPVQARILQPTQAGEEPYPIIWRDAA